MELDRPYFNRTSSDVSNVFSIDEPRVKMFLDSRIMTAAAMNQDLSDLYDQVVRIKMGDFELAFNMLILTAVTGGRHHGREVLELPSDEGLTVEGLSLLFKCMHEGQVTLEAGREQGYRAMAVASALGVEGIEFEYL